MISNQFYLFLFLIFFQLAYSKVNNPDPKRFLDSFETFKKLDQQKASTTKKITLFTGSSSIRMWESLEDDFPEINLINRGFGGAHLSDVIFFYERLFPNYKPEQIVLYCGEKLKQICQPPIFTIFHVNHRPKEYQNGIFTSL